MDAIKGMIPGMGGDEESPEEKEKARKAAIVQADRERRSRYKTVEDARETERQVIREKYNIEKKLNTEDEMSEDDDEGFGGGGAKKEEDDDPAAQAKRLAEENMKKAQEMAAGKCSLQ